MSSKFSDSPEYQKLYKEWNEKINAIPTPEIDDNMGQMQFQLGTSTIPDMIKEREKEDL